jgi:hypothetical protein
VRQAIATVGARSPSPLRRIAGPSSRISAQSAAPGEVGPDALAAMLEVLRAELRRIWGRVARKWERRVAGLMERLTHALRDSRRTLPNAG